MKINTDHLSLESFWEQHISGEKISIDQEVLSNVSKNRKYLQERIANSDEAIYGINTGFGSLCDVRISQDNMEDLQHNLVVSHACGTGDLVPEEIVKTIVVLKILNLCKAYSGVRVSLIEQLVNLYNKEVLPIIFELGSLGASGDLAPLAHMSLPLLGIGEVYYKDEIKSAEEVLSTVNESAIELSFKEGLALLNGTQFSLAYCIHSVVHAEKLYRIANMTASISLLAYNCKTDPFDPILHKIRKHKGQEHNAAEIYAILKQSNLDEITKHNVQDPYSFRCVPQVHGASKAAIDHVKDIAENELNAVTDNPNIFEEEDKVIIGGNFHAQPLALPMDYLAIALSELGSISERRTYKLINGDRDLPPYLAKNPGLNSGFMICQYTAASIVSQNKQLCTPASVDSITSSKGQEDHVSMAANAGTKLYRVANNLYRILSIEFMVAVEALSYRKDLKLPLDIKNIVEAYRQQVGPLEKDRYLSPDIMETEYFLRNRIGF